jgi:translation initiation factor IF-3
VTNRGVEVNERITSQRVRLIDADGVQKGVVSIRDALWQARQANLDLVKIAEANPPVCKIVDAGKYIYEQNKAKKEQAKRQRASAVELKEVQLRPSTDLNDIKIKARKARAFLDDGDKVKVVMRFRGREITHQEVGQAVINTFINELGEVRMEQPVTQQGNQITALIAPAKKEQKQEKTA